MEKEYRRNKNYKQIMKKNCIGFIETYSYFIILLFHVLIKLYS